VLPLPECPRITDEDVVAYDGDEWLRMTELKGYLVLNEDHDSWVERGAPSDLASEKKRVQVDASAEEPVQDARDRWNEEYG